MKRKVFNDPVFGFISIPNDLIFEIIETPVFQRLRRIQQLGLTHLVYPGALHTRFHHALGAMHLMEQAIEVIRSKGHKVTEEERFGAITAILLHDIGHGPFSHALENSIILGSNHEKISLTIMKHLNRLFDNNLDLAIEIFQGNYKKKYLRQLISGQLDMDRLDYLTRDSFFTGVSEGVIGTERILKMIDIHNNSVVIEEKGIYSIEKFLIARQLMFWQVYLHKTAISAEVLLTKILQRAYYLSENGKDLPCTENLLPFLKNKITKKDFLENTKYLDVFTRLDDFDVISSIKMWMNNKDFLLSKLSKNLIERKLFKTVISETELNNNKREKIKKYLSDKMKISLSDVKYVFYSEPIISRVYDSKHNPINILFKNNRIEDISKASKTLRMGLLSTEITRHYIWFPKEFSDDIMKIIESDI